MFWLSDVKELKSTVNNYENHKNLIKKYRETEVLYIDDFFKTGKYSINIKPDKNKNYRRKNITEY